MKKIALTGGIASGKSTVAKILEENKIAVIYADKVSAEVLFNEKQKVLEILGPSILDENKNLDKSKIREIIFFDSEKKKSLERLLHPKIKAKINKQICDLQDDLVVVEVPLLFESGWQNDFDEVWLIKSKHQKQRLIKRDGINFDLALSIIKSQNDNSKLVDVIIKNDKNVDDLKHKIKNLLKK